MKIRLKLIVLLHSLRLDTPMFLNLREILCFVGDVEKMYGLDIIM